MSNIKILHYEIKYQDSNVAIIRFPKKEISDFLKKTEVFIENCDSHNPFLECFEDTLMEICGVAFVIVDVYKITVIKEPELTNWGNIIEDTIWSSLFFFNLFDGAIQISRCGKPIGKLVKIVFNEAEPEYPHKK